SPTVAYAPLLDHIVIGFYNNQEFRYYGTKLEMDGLTYISPMSPSIYYQINMVQANITGRIAFSTSQQEYAKGLFMSYSTKMDSSPLTGWDITRKRVRWDGNIPFAGKKKVENTLPI